MFPSANGCANSGTSSGQLDNAPASARMFETANITWATLRMTVPGRLPRLTVTEKLKRTWEVAPAWAGRAMMTVDGPSR